MQIPERYIVYVLTEPLSFGLSLFLSTSWMVLVYHDGPSLRCLGYGVAVLLALIQFMVTPIVRIGIELVMRDRQKRSELYNLELSAKRKLEKKLRIKKTN